MIELDDELAKDYLAESREHLATMETCLLSIEKGGAAIGEELVNRAFRAVHSVQGGASIFDMVKIGDLSHQTENVLVLIRSREMVPTPERVGVLLRAADRLHELIQNPGTSNQPDISEVMAALARLLTDPRASAMKDSAPPIERTAKGGRNLWTLLVEDDFASRLLLQTFLSRYGECHIAVNGREAVRSALERGERYD